jgi:hypothetical protein
LVALEVDVLHVVVLVPPYAGAASGIKRESQCPG